MPFETIQTHAKGNEPPTAKLSYMRPQRNGVTKKDAKPVLRITIPTTMCGTSKSATFVLQVGTGDDLGKVRVAGITGKAGDGSLAGVEPKQTANAFIWNFGFVPLLGDDIFDDERGTITKIDGETFEISVTPSLFAPA